jgi:hypothetical protein
MPATHNSAASELNRADMQSIPRKFLLCFLADVGVLLRSSSWHILVSTRLLARLIPGSGMSLIGSSSVSSNRETISSMKLESGRDGGSGMFSYCLLNEDSALGEFRYPAAGS